MGRGENLLNCIFQTVFSCVYTSTLCAAPFIQLDSHERKVGVSCQKNSRVCQRGYHIELYFFEPDSIHEFFLVIVTSSCFFVFFLSPSRKREEKEKEKQRKTDSASLVILFPLRIPRLDPLHVGLQVIGRVALQLDHDFLIV